MLRRTRLCRVLQVSACAGDRHGGETLAQLDAAAPIRVVPLDIRDKPDDHRRAH